MSKPPKREVPKAGEVWFMQTKMHRPLMTVEIIEATPKTVLVMLLADGSAKASATALRYKIRDFKWIEQVPA